jgi:hypothetical protein
LGFISLIILKFATSAVLSMIASCEIFITRGLSPLPLSVLDEKQPIPFVDYFRKYSAI